MLFTTLTYIALAFSLLSCIFAGIATQLAMRQVRDERDFRGILLHLQELEDNHEALSASHKRLRSRIGMQEMRARKRNGDDSQNALDLPDPRQDPEGWKREMRLRLHTKQAT
jgi:biopolymer transport protein ExbB/TolQ